MRDRLYLLTLVLIFFLAFILRFYELGSIPRGLQQDETSIGYNAYSILKTGKDEYGTSYPLYFKAFGEYKLPGYVYLSVIPISFFGLTEYAVRFPSALFGSLTIMAFYFLLRQILDREQKEIALVGALLLAMNPWHIHFSRGAFEVTVALFFLTLGTFSFIVALRKNLLYALLSGFCFAFSVYTYTISRLFVPCLILLLIYLYRKNIKVEQRKALFLFLITTVLLLLPFFLTLFSRGGFSASSGTLIFSSAAVKAPLLEYRSYFIDEPVLMTKILFNFFALTGLQYIKNIFSYLSADFFFLSGSSHGNHGIGNVGMFYLFELPTMLLGMFYAFTKHKKYFLFFFWAIVSVLIASLTREAPQATRSFYLTIPLSFFSALGIYHVLMHLKNIRRNYLRIFLCNFIAIFVLYNIVYYFSSYYVRFPIFYAKSWRATDKVTTDYLVSHGSEYNQIVIDSDSGFLYTSYLFYSKYPPEQFQKTVRRLPDDREGFSKVVSFGKFTYKTMDWSMDYQKKNELILTTADRKPKDIPSLVSFYYPKRPVALSVNEEILQYPVEDVSYVLVKSE